MVREAPRIQNFRDVQHWPQPSLSSGNSSVKSETYTATCRWYFEKKKELEQQPAQSDKIQDTITQCLVQAPLVAQKVKNLPAVQETWVQSLSWEDPLEEGMATHSSILPGEFPWTEELGGLQSKGVQESYTTEWLSTVWYIHIHFW